MSARVTAILMNDIQCFSNWTVSETGGETDAWWSGG